MSCVTPKASIGSSDRRIAQRHRMSVGTIVADASMLVKMMNGRNVGSIEESFITRLRKGDTFVFGGRLLELVRIHEMTAFVQPAKRRSGVVPRWSGDQDAAVDRDGGRHAARTRRRRRRPLRRAGDAAGTAA